MARMTTYDGVAASSQAMGTTACIEFRLGTFVRPFLSSIQKSHTPAFSSLAVSPS